MSASMAETLAEHYVVRIFGPRCRCGMSLGSNEALAAHQADVLAANGYGKLPETRQQFNPENDQVWMPRRPE